jgi:tetratricopeptide (TPR) repeat protein
MAINIAKQNKEPSAIYYINRANSYFELAKYTETLNDCTAAKEIDANYAKIYWRVAKVMEQLKKRDVGLNVLKQAVEKGLFDLKDTKNAFTKFHN